MKLIMNMNSALDYAPAPNCEDGAPGSACPAGICDMADAPRPLAFRPERTLRYDEMVAARLAAGEGISHPAVLPPGSPMPPTEDRTLPPDEFAALLAPREGMTPAPAAPPTAPAPTLSLRAEKTPTEFSHLYAALERQAAGLGDVTLLSHETLGAASPYVLGITSAVAGEGKTTVALHLAMTIARDTFKKVCLLDMSLGGSDLAARLGVPATGEGVVAVLEDSGTVVPTLQLSGCDNLVIIPAGKAPTNAAKLARSPRVEQLIVSARFAFDVVIIDLPSVASDNALPLARSVDGLVMVVRAGATPQDVVSRALDMLGREKVLGVTLNRVPAKRRKWWGRK